MQDAVSQIMLITEFEYQYGVRGVDYKPPLNVYREIGIRKIGRVSDIIVEITPRKIVNIECKMFDYTCVIEQAFDHLLWADYSYICMHERSMIPNYIIKDMIGKGLGLMLWSKRKGLIDVIGASHNTFKNGHKKKPLRESVKARMDKAIPISPKSANQGQGHLSSHL